MRSAAWSRVQRRARNCTVPLVLACVALQLPGCWFNWSERDILEVGASFCEAFALPLASMGPQPFADGTGECYYAYRSGIHRLSDDSLVFDGLDESSSSIARAACLGACDLKALIANPASESGASVVGVPRLVATLDERTGAQREFMRGLPIVDLGAAHARGDLVVAFATADAGFQVDSSLALCDSTSGEIEVSQSWTIRDLLGLDCTPDASTVVFAGEVDGVQGVYACRATEPSVPVLVERSAILPSVRADGLEIAMVRSEPKGAWHSARFRDTARVHIADVRTGTRRDIEIGKNIAVFGLRYVENPRRLLVSGARANAKGEVVEWLIWNIRPDGGVDVVRRWDCRRGELVLDS